MMSEYDKMNVGNLLAGEGTWFNAHLLRLISKADDNNTELLRKGFPEQVKAVEEFRTGPIGEFEKNAVDIPWYDGDL
jgi:hypothetical protein